VARFNLRKTILFYMNSDVDDLYVKIVASMRSITFKFRVFSFEIVKMLKNIIKISTVY
jgi:hypothetical protein